MAIQNKQHQRADSQVRRFFRRLSLQRCDSEKSTFAVDDAAVGVTQKTAFKRYNSTPEPASEDSSSLVSQQPPRSRHVRFSDDVQVLETRHHDHTAARWYSAREIETFQLEARAQAEAILHNVTENTPSQVAYQLYAAGLAEYQRQPDQQEATRGLHGLASGRRSSPCHRRLVRRLRDLNDLPDAERRARVQCQASLCASQASRLTAAQLGRWWAARYNVVAVV